MVRSFLEKLDYSISQKVLAKKILRPAVLVAEVKKMGDTLRIAEMEESKSKSQKVDSEELLRRRAFLIEFKKKLTQQKPSKSLKDLRQQMSFNDFASMNEEKVNHIFLNVRWTLGEEHYAGRDNETLKFITDWYAKTFPHDLDPSIIQTKQKLANASQEQDQQQTASQTTFSPGAGR